MIDLSIDRLRRSVEPLAGADKILELFGRHDILNSERDDPPATIYHAFNFANNMWRSVSRGREDYNHDRSLIDRLNDRAPPIGARRYVARGDPTVNRIRLKCLADLVCDASILKGVADEYLWPFAILSG